jgi:hypothetical protein
VPRAHEAQIKDSVDGRLDTLVHAAYYTYKLIYYLV